jgi:hypothetical protein
LILADAVIPWTELEANSDSPLFLNIFLNIFLTLFLTGLEPQMEGAGVALAILPFLLNQLDNYVQGLETLKGFRAKRYRRELDGYLSGLWTQQAIFVNTLERSLDGVVD